VTTVNGSKKTRPTIADVARLSGVSKATVSRVLNGSARVLPETREAVERAIQDVGYSESWQAKSLATGRAGAIGVILTEPFDDVYSDPTFAATLRGVYDRLAETPLVPILLQASSGPERDKAMRFLERGGADAVIHLTPYVDDGLLPQLAGRQFPTVVVGRPDAANSERFGGVYSDDVVGGRLAAAQAAGRGATRPLVVVGPEDNPASVERVDGYREVFGAALDGRIRFGGWDDENGRATVADALQCGLEMDVVLAGSDRIARGAMQALREHGLRVPEDVAVIGFDNHAMSAQTDPPLTTIEQPLREEGAKAVDLALELLDGRAPRTCVLPMRLVVRASA
jgi:DNA-binding LacI/PurR family transcriptional regulator